MHQILFRPARGDYSARPEPLAGRGLLLRGMGGEKGKGGRGLRKGREGRNVAFHHPLLSNLTTALTTSNRRIDKYRTVIE